MSLPGNLSIQMTIDHSPIIFVEKESVKKREWLKG
jgi:hypothetical protein